MSTPPWYVWLSLIGFMGLFAALGLKQLWDFFAHRLFSMSRWISFLGHSMGLFVLLFMIPSFLLTTLISGLFKETSLPWDTALCVLWAYIYFIGVFLAAHLRRWGKKQGLL